MKLSATINFFNSEELIKDVVLNIRPLVDHLSVVYQEYSNCNEKITDEAKQLLNELISQRLVDDVVCYQPDFNIIPSLNEFNKRKIGLELARSINASHFLLMDSDEFYDQEQFINAKRLIEIEDITYSCVHSYFYLRRPIYRSKFIDTTNVCFIVKITPELEFKYNQNFPIDYVDPTRRLINESGTFKLFDKDTIVMHHMNFVRKNFNSKLKNTSSGANSEFIKQARIALFNWKWNNIFIFPNKPEYEIIKVPDKFNLDEIFNKKTILIMNQFLKDFSGSEIAVYDVAKEFINLGFKVTLGSFKFTSPLKDLFDELDCDFIDLNTLTEKDDDKFDIIWAQHFTTLDKILLETKILSNFVIFSSLSPYEALESPPLSAEKVNLFLANSFETKEKLIEMGLFEESIYLLPNPISDDFFKISNNYSGELKRIAVVSNHIPEEIRETIIYLKNDGLDVVLYGVEGIFELITPSILEQYDAVITIGRTIQYSLAKGLPVYCYDRFGGCGWITSSNIEEAAKFNFSGRCTNRKLTVNEIVKEIKENYNIAKSNINSNREFAQKNYKLGSHLETILSHYQNNKVNFSINFFKNIALRQRKYFINNSDFFLIQDLWKRVNQSELKLEESEQNNQDLWKRVNQSELKLEESEQNNQDLWKRVNQSELKLEEIYKNKIFRIVKRFI
jgi:hypothetical protein